MYRRYRLACLATHPIQYQAPLFRMLTARGDLELKVFFLSDLSVRGARDSGFGIDVKWDVPLLEGYDYEFLPSFGARDRLSFWRPLAARLFPSRARAREFDALWVHGYAHHALLMAIFLAHRNGMKVLLRGDSQLAGEPVSLVRLRLKRALIPQLFGLIDGFLAIGIRNRDYYLSYGIAPERIFVMPYAVDNVYFSGRAAAAHPARENFRASLGLAPDRPVILYASKLQAHKRPRDLLEAHARLARELNPAPYLVFVGDGEERSALEARAREFMSDSVRFFGFRNQSELPAFYDLADVFVLPSERDAWGLVLNEVMNAARPVIVSDRVGAAPDLVEDGVNGFVYPVGDVEALAERLARVLGSPERAAQMGRASLERVAHYTYEADAEALVAALDSLIVNRARVAA
jgi:glycosyltransferase involved in cell wall biosynthesis